MLHNQQTIRTTKGAVKETIYKVAGQCDGTWIHLSIHPLHMIYSHLPIFSCFDVQLSWLHTYHAVLHTVLIVSKIVIMVVIGNKVKL